MNAILFAIGILFGAVGATLMKVGAGTMGAVQFNSAHEIIIFFGKLLTNFAVVGGMSLYFLSAVVWLYLLTKLDVSYVQPILALTYVLTPILAIIFLGESVPPMRWLGIAIIIFGVFVVARTASS
jgi:drug/metabolite transporter (DMT)-like permease